jgi:signal transduction histidine kinase
VPARTTPAGVDAATLWVRRQLPMAGHTLCQVAIIENAWRGHRGAPFFIGRYLLPIALGAVQVIGSYIASNHHRSASRPLDAVAMLLLLAGPVALLFRHRFPAAVLAFTLGATLTYFLMNYARGPVFLALIAAFISAVMKGRRIPALALLLAGYVSFLWLGYLLGIETAPGWSEALGLGAWLLVLAALGETLRGRRERGMEYARTRREEARRQASEERLRIARELHDVLAHNISLMNVQAGVALHLMDQQPEQARTALIAIRDASNEALRELRSVLDVLRQRDEEPPRSPTSGLAQLDELISRSQAAGVQIDRRIEGSPRSLPASTDLAAFRIVQEALTNVTRHAGNVNATVTICYGPHELMVEVENQITGTSQEVTGGGNGIPGMRERAVALGGDVDAGPTAGGTFRVKARLPLVDAPPEGTA